MIPGMIDHKYRIGLTTQSTHYHQDLLHLSLNPGSSVPSHIVQNKLIGFDQPHYTPLASTKILMTKDDSSVLGTTNNMKSSASHQLSSCTSSSLSCIDVLAKHKSSHLGRCTYCDICQKFMPNYERYVDHMNMHRKIKAHQCPWCFKSFTFKSDVRRHIRNKVCMKLI